MTASLPSENVPPRITLLDRRSQQKGGRREDIISNPNYSRLRVRVQIYPVSNTSFFHIAVNLYFLTGGEQHAGNMDMVELLCLADASGTNTRHHDQSTQGNHTNGSTAQASSKLGPTALVEIAVGGELLMVNVLSERKPSGKKDGVGNNQGLCHCVTVRVSKAETGGTKISKKTDKIAGWLRRLSPIRRAVTTEDQNEKHKVGEDQPKRSGGAAELFSGRKQRRPQQANTAANANPLRMDDDSFDSTNDPRIWYPIRSEEASCFANDGSLEDGISNRSISSDIVSSINETKVCLQSWSVKSISSQEVWMAPTTEPEDRERLIERHSSEATIFVGGDRSTSQVEEMDLMWI